MARSTASAIVAGVRPAGSGGPPAWPGSVGASTSWRRSSAGSVSSQVRQVSVNPCRSTSGGPEPPRCAAVNTAASLRRLLERDGLQAVLLRGGHRAGDLVLVHRGRGAVVGGGAAGGAEEALDAAGREAHEDPARRLCRVAEVVD